MANVERNGSYTDNLNSSHYKTTVNYWVSASPSSVRISVGVERTSYSNAGLKWRAYLVQGGLRVGAVNGTNSPDETQSATIYVSEKYQNSHVEFEFVGDRKTVRVETENFIH